MSGSMSRRCPASSCIDQLPLRRCVSVAAGTSRSTSSNLAGPPRTLSTACGYIHAGVSKAKSRSSQGFIRCIDLSRVESGSATPGTVLTSGACKYFVPAPNSRTTCLVLLHHRYFPEADFWPGQFPDCPLSIQDAGITRGGQVVYFVPITIESGPTKCSIRVSRNPACFIHCEQSAPV